MAGIVGVFGSVGHVTDVELYAGIEAITGRRPPRLQVTTTLDWLGKFHAMRFEFEVLKCRGAAVEGTYEVVA